MASFSNAVAPPRDAHAVHESVLAAEAVTLGPDSSFGGRRRRGSRRRVHIGNLGGVTKAAEVGFLLLTYL